MRLMLKRWIAKLANMYEDRDGRERVRIPADFQATLTGPFGTLHVTGADAHRKGAGVQSPMPLEIGTLAFMRIAGLGLMGFAHVRHCSERNGGYLLGLEFREALTRDRAVEADWSCERARRDAYRVWDEADA